MTEVLWKSCFLSVHLILSEFGGQKLATGLDETQGRHSNVFYVSAQHTQQGNYLFGNNSINITKFADFTEEAYREKMLNV